MCGSTTCACATLLLSKGVSVKVVQEALGHSSVSLTIEVYSHVVPDMQEKAAAVMDDRRLSRVPGTPSGLHFCRI